jgi:hypothetical protein
MNRIDDWEQILACLPNDLEERAKATGAFTRARGVPNAKTLLRLLLAYCATRMSFRQTVTWAKNQDLAHLSDVSLIERMERCESWISGLLQTCLAIEKPAASTRPIHLVDATHIVSAEKQLWRLHIVYDACCQTVEQVVLADSHTAENFQNFKAQAGVLYLADRAYGTPKSIASILDAGGEVLCRMKAARYLPHANSQKVVEIQAERGRVIMAPIPAEKLAKAEKRVKRKASRNQRQINEKTLEANRYLCLFCSDNSLTAQEAVDLYRWRWQIELQFKRLKSLQNLDEMTLKSPLLIRVYLLCHTLLAVIAQQLQQAAVFSPKHA